ncbi:glycosyltransferase family 2 protein [Aerococcus urinaeequi]|uniref:glycosyltransferase family 2 protein n=1 Tax=Aerococcus urinaeequi TaxID=51665 RepID=UPI003D6A618E
MLTIIVPCYNEEETIPLFFEAVESQKSEMDMTFEYIFVNDGSKDQTLKEIRRLVAQFDYVHFIDFSRNFGKEAAMYAGLQKASGDFITIMDADLQDPPELLPQMLKMLEANSDLDCVGTRRVTRDGESATRSFLARTFYKLMDKISDAQLVDGARDFRMMRRQMVDAILSLTEYNRFSKGLFTWVGFKTEYLTYKNRERVAGQTSWSLKQLFSYSVEGITDFSDLPLSIATYMGMVSCIVAILSIIVIVLRTLIFGDPTDGWPSLVSIILLLGGIQLLCIGIIGKYVGKIYLETKNRPIYIIKDTDIK